MNSSYTQNVRWSYFLTSTTTITPVSAICVTMNLHFEVLQLFYAISFHHRLQLIFPAVTFKITVFFFFQNFFSISLQNTPRQKSIRALEIFRVQKLILNATS